MEYTTGTVTAYLGESKESYVVFSKPNLGNQLDLVGARGPEGTAKFLSGQVKEIVGVTVDGQPLKPADFRKWPLQLVADVLTAYTQAVALSVDASTQGAEEKK